MVILPLRAFLRRNSVYLVAVLVLATTAAFVWDLPKDAGGWTNHARFAVVWFCGLASGWLLFSIK